MCKKLSTDSHTKIPFQSRFIKTMYSYEGKKKVENQTIYEKIYNR